MICPALNQKKKHLAIAHSQQKWFWKCSPVSGGAALRYKGSREHREGAKSGQRYPRQVGIYKTTPSATGEMGKMRTAIAIVKSPAPTIVTASYTITFFTWQEHWQQPGFPGWWHRQSSQKGNKESPELVGYEPLRDAAPSCLYHSWFNDFPTPSPSFFPICCN